MASITLMIGGNSYSVACRDDEEAHLRALAVIVEQKITQVRGTIGGMGEVRQLLLASLLLADELSDAQQNNVSDNSVALGKIADRIETIASRLENVAETS
jgi:cell division protein ZapA